MEDFLNGVLEFIDVGLYEYADTFLQRVGAYLFVWYLELKVSTITFAWSIASGFIQALNLTGMMSAAFSNLSPDFVAFANYVKLFEAMNIIFSAYSTRFVLDLF